MTALLCTLLALPCTTNQTPSYVQKAGIAKHYTKGLAQTVIANRQNPDHWGYVRGFVERKDVHGWAASVDCWRIGQVVTARLNGRKLERFQLIDCSQPKHRARHIREGLVIEVDYESAVRNGFARAGKARATVWYR